MAGKVAGVLGTAALTAHAIHKALKAPYDPHAGWERVDVQHHGVMNTVRF